MAKGYLALVLHAHLPFVRHPEYDSFLEERWLFEAMTETYIPLLKFFDALSVQKVPFRITVSLSPSLLAMLEDELLQSRYLAHLDKLIELSHREQERTRHHGHLHWLAGMYTGLFEQARTVFTGCDCRLSKAFGRLASLGGVELITCSATHGILPILQAQPGLAQAQVSTGVDYFEKVMGFRPAGFWLPECAWAPGIDRLLHAAGIRYFFVESNAIANSSPAPLRGIHAPLFTESGVAAFGRDQHSLEEVWSARKGYPGDGVYREFYRDIGHELDWHYIHPYIAGDVRVDTGIKYHRITGPGAHKDLYHPDQARERAAQHARNFLDKRIGQIEHLCGQAHPAPVVVAPFDAELFGHWWFEGPQWLDFLIRKAAFDQNVVELITPSDYLQRHPLQQTATPQTSTWGHKGYFEVWLNGKNDWIYGYLFECGRRMQDLAQRFARRKPDALTVRCLNQCGRELLLAQSSDWPFIIHGGTAAQYAQRRVKDHVSRFHTLADMIDKNEVDGEILAAIEQIDTIFADLHYSTFLPPPEA